MPLTPSPLRYPGGKTKLSAYLREIIALNNLQGCPYIEPYAGGAGLALSLLFSGHVGRIHLNDFDRSIYALWHTILNEADTLCDYIENVDITLEERENQKEMQEYKDRIGLTSLGISTFFLNRTNRSGIISAGVIGGKRQDGKYKIDARFTKKTLIEKIQKISAYRDEITISNCDAFDFLQNDINAFPKQTLVNLDPPYYEKGQQLYKNAYEHNDHEKIANIIHAIKPFWLITYDNVVPIREMYHPYRQLDFSIRYSAQKKYVGKEVLITDSRLILPSEVLLKAV